MEILRNKELIDVPWKNGGGITRNIAKGLNRDHAAWTISRADVAQDGAFSNFAGLQRVLTVVSDTGMTLEHSGGAWDADPWQPVCFGGEVEVFSRLKNGPLTDFNLMFDPTLCDGSVTVLRGPVAERVSPTETGIRAFHVLAGTPRLDAEPLGAGDTAFLDAAVSLDLGADAAVLEIVISYADQSSDIRFCIAAR